jgi:hypothetical protein
MGSQSATPAGAIANVRWISERPVEAGAATRAQPKLWLPRWRYTLETPPETPVHDTDAERQWWLVFTVRLDAHQNEALRLKRVSDVGPSKLLFRHHAKCLSVPATLAEVIDKVLEVSMGKGIPHLRRRDPPYFLLIVCNNNRLK